MLGWTALSLSLQCTLTARWDLRLADLAALLMMVAAPVATRRRLRRTWQQLDVEEARLAVKAAGASMARHTDVRENSSRRRWPAVIRRRPGRKGVATDCGSALAKHFPKPPPPALARRRRCEGPAAGRPAGARRMWSRGDAKGRTPQHRELAEAQGSHFVRAMFAAEAVAAHLSSKRAGNGLKSIFKCG